MDFSGMALLNIFHYLYNYLIVIT